MAQKKRTLIAFATRWGTQFGGVNSFNADLLRALVANFNNYLRTVCIVLDATPLDVEDAKSNGVLLLSLNAFGAKEFDVSLESKVSQTLQNNDIQHQADGTTWLGHDRITGAIALALSKKCGGQSVLIHHMSYAHYEVFAESNASSYAKKSEQRKLFSQANVALAVGPLLRDALKDLLNKCEIKMLIPGLAEIEPRSNSNTFSAFLSGRLNDSARKIKQAYLGVAAFGYAIEQCSKNVGLPDALGHTNSPRLILRGVEFEETTGNIDSNAEQDLKVFSEEWAKCAFTLEALPFTANREDLFNDLRAASVAMMPSWHEGFGLVAWEAIAAGVPLIVSSKSGVYRLLHELDNGLYTSLVSIVDVMGSNKTPWFHPNDPETLAKALIQIAKDPLGYREKASRLRTELLKRFSWEDCARQFWDAMDWGSLSQPVTPAAPNAAVGTTFMSVPVSILDPLEDLSEIRTWFASISAIGRSWRRDIAGRRIPSAIVDKLISALNGNKRSILLTGLPGAGKTCAMLALQEALELRSKSETDLLPLFIQSSEFADKVTMQERHDQGLPVSWVENIARISTQVRVVVIIDSLDVLSIAREHSVLTYFLAQIDRLLLNPNVSVVTACRDFDRQFDRRIAAREWDIELVCPALDWAIEIEPLLVALDIDIRAIDNATRDLIRYPRELGLFVELAKQDGSFSVITSQGLAQRYLAKIVNGDNELGDKATQIMEEIAAEMLNNRSIAVSRQPFNDSPTILRALFHHKLLHETNEGKLAFGHQTLLDVLVISRAMRLRTKLNEFIAGLPPVPFVRPSIRSFIAQLALGARSEFRKQLRPVLSGVAAFHIRRLVAESFAEQKPVDEDWPMINELRKEHTDVYQVIYTRATLIEWHHFWLKHLVPALKHNQDAEGMAMHVHRVSQWKNEDASQILEFWRMVLNLDWVNSMQIIGRLTGHLADIKLESTVVLEPLVKLLLKLPQQEHSFLGKVVVRCVSECDKGDALLWSFVAGGIRPEDAIAFDFGKRLRCQPHEFGTADTTYFRQRMQESTTLLDLALASVEQWGRIKRSQFDEVGGYWAGFLYDTSFNDERNQNDLHRIDSTRILFDAMEAAIVAHARMCTEWWLTNREQVSFSKEGAIRYFAIHACTISPLANIDLIGRLLCDQKLFESDLSYELGTLLHVAFIYLQPESQNALLNAIMSIRAEDENDERYGTYVLEERGQLVAAIPCHLRSPSAQALVDKLEAVQGVFIRQPRLHIVGGWVDAPFSFEVFINFDDSGVLRLLSHYAGHPNGTGRDFLVGGELEVGLQLREAASRNPKRFLDLVSFQWVNIPKSFRNYILDGVANYLAYCHGNLQKNPTWKPIGDFESLALARQVLVELANHTSHWNHNPAASNALQACANVIENTEDATQLVFLAIGFENFREESFSRSNNLDLVSIGINMVRGHVVEALMISAVRLHKEKISFPELMLPTLFRFAQNEDTAIRAVILRRLPYFISKNLDFGWAIFDRAMQDSKGLWVHAEGCLYHAIQDNIEIVNPILLKLKVEGSTKDLEVWGRISALAALTEELDFRTFLEELKVLDSTEAWHGAALVWAHPKNVIKFADQCFLGAEAGLKARKAHAIVVAKKIAHLFTDDKSPVSVEVPLIRRCIDVIEGNDANNYHDFMGLEGWLNVTAQHDPERALAVLEIYLGYVTRKKSYIHDYENKLTQLLTRLFAEAEEREELDQGCMLARVVTVQDTLLGLGVDGVAKWLEAAERP